VKLEQLFIIFKKLPAPTAIKVSSCYSSSTDRCNSLLQTLAPLVSQTHYYKLWHRLFLKISHCHQFCPPAMDLFAFGYTKREWTSSMAHIPKELTDRLAVLFGLTKTIPYNI